jgi:hypothetical protein
MPRVEFVPTIPGFERGKMFHVLDRAASSVRNYFLVELSLWIYCVIKRRKNDLVQFHLYLKNTLSELWSEPWSLLNFMLRFKLSWGKLLRNLTRVNHNSFPTFSCPFIISSSTHFHTACHVLASGQLIRLKEFNQIVRDYCISTVGHLVEVFQWPPTQHLTNKTDIKSVNILFYYIYVHYVFRSERSSSSHIHEYIYTRTCSGYM